MLQYLSGSFTILSVLTAGCADPVARIPSGFTVTVKHVVADDRISVWELEVVTQQNCNVIVTEGNSGRTSVWVRPKPSGLSETGRIVIAASLVPSNESQKGTLTFLARVHATGALAGGPGTYQIDADGLQSVVSVDVQDQKGVFGTPIHIGKVNGQDLTLTVELE